jgi:segregation and condensation protein B
MRKGPAPRKVIEAILLLAEEPVPASLIGEVLEMPRAEVEDVLAELTREYEDDDRGFVLRRSEPGWRLYSHPDCAPWLERFVRGHRSARLTGAALEVLAIIAYRQPVSRAQIADVRGVDSDGVVRTLLNRGLVREARERGPGAAALLVVSDEFMERMGLQSMADLPPLAGFMPDPEAVEEMEARLSPDA